MVYELESDACHKKVASKTEILKSSHYMGKQRAIISRYASVAKDWLKKGHVLAMEFSGPTYQVEVKDPAYTETLWPFLQLNPKGEVKDLFCGCDAVDDTGGCLHVATALLSIYDAKGVPLHIRFEKSLWNVLCTVLAENIGYETSLIKKQKEGVYSYEKLFRIEGRNAQAKKELTLIFGKRANQTEETSLKFSNLPQEEIAHWREGRASPALLYELSFWSDLAKKFFFLQENKLPYTLTFKEGKSGLPEILSVSFKDFDVVCQIKEKDLPTLIPALSTVHSSLEVMKNKGEGIEKITYDPTLKAFHIARKTSEKKRASGVSIGQWDYISNVGFALQKQKTPFDKAVIPENEIASFLNAYATEIKPLLQGTPLHEEPVDLRYQIQFDENWNLHFQGYLFEPGDLKELFGNYAYVESKGFYPIHRALFETRQKTISSWHVSEFVGEHRVWLNNQRGFATHLLPIEAPLSYTLKEGMLAFESAFAKKGNTKDFGDWVYVKDEGFFAKKQTRAQPTVFPGLEVLELEIPSFIASSKEELEGIPKFFASSCPLLKRGIKVELIENKKIQISPQVERAPLFKNKELHFFGDVVFVEGEGFYELPPHLHIPPRFSDSVLLQKDLIPYFLRFELKALLGVAISVDPRLVSPVQLDLEVQYLAKNPSGGLKGRFFYKTEKGEIPVSQIKEAMLKKESFLFHKGGLIDLSDEKFVWIKGLQNELDMTANTITLSTLEFLRLEATEKLFAPKDESPLGVMTRTLLKEIRDFSTFEPYDLTGLTSELRPYQKTGVNWLWFLYRNDLAGLLCDEMGLGKTHQALALMAAIFNKIKTGATRFLVVCPTSVIYHWEDKFDRFLPKLKVHTFHGGKRTLKNLPKRGVLLTTYGIVRQEKEALGKLKFELAVFDEIQSAKNPHSRVHQALAKIQAKMSVGLTGTPIENNLRELKSLFDIVLPTYMPSEAKFRELYIKPIEREGDNERREALKALIHPFLLRRKKAEVLEELPEKTEENAYMELSEEQLVLYEQTLRQSQKKILTDLKNDINPIPYIHIFALLMQLKQICNHPALFAKDPLNYKKYQSGKWDLFVELMEEVNESEQKVVVFSQYLNMLDIIELFIKDRGWGYAQIRGDTLDRKEQIQRFQQDPNCQVFIGSLGAAGVGIDLTAASTVILYDRWWNPARENQAIDRVHRIGQKWGVQVFKLITKETIEERIEQIVQKKQKLMEEVLGADDQDAIKTLSRQDLISLLSL